MPGIETERYATASASSLAAAVRAREVSSRELLAMYVERCERLGPSLNAVVTLAVERAQREAFAADEATAHGRMTGPLHGVPFTVKDALMTEGIRSACGSPDMAQFVPAEDAAAVQRLRAAGGIVFGKTNTPLWCLDVQTHNAVFGVTSNPWDRGRTCGGSSGGSAAAVAAGLTGFDVGTDIGGSVRIPAHFCGTYSLKPTFGIVPQRGYIDHLGGSSIEPDLNVIGPLARSGEDLSLLIDVLAGQGAPVSEGWSLRLPAPRPGLADCRVGTWFSDPRCPPSEAYATLLTSLQDKLAAAGVRVADARPQVDFSEQTDLWLQLLSAAACLALPDGQAREMGGSHLNWIRAAERRVELSAIWDRWFASYDLMLCPVWPREAFPHDHEGDVFSRTVPVDGQARPHVECGRWLGLIGVVGLPAAIVPIGQLEGLPVGVQVVAPRFHDQRAVHAAAAIGALAGGYQVPPGFGPR